MVSKGSFDMIVYPDFYPEFRCIANACLHSCCRGWEIDIDEDTAQLYDGILGELGQMIRRSISRDPEPHFVLTDDERCPFLQTDGLCRLILTLGEDSLCDICTEHPRFYNQYPDRTEIGLGLCCEEAVRLLLSSDAPLRLITEPEPGDEPCPTPALILREQIFDILADSALPLCERMDSALRLADAAPLDLTTREVAEFFLTLERLDEDWTRLLNLLAQRENAPLPQPEGAAYERIAEYLIYRHFAVGDTAADCARRLRFAFLGTRVLSALDALNDTPLPELLRLFSAEIEYSDQNLLIANEHFA